MEVTKVRRHREARQEKKELQAGRQEGERGKRVCTKKIRHRGREKANRYIFFFRNGFYRHFLTNCRQPASGCRHLTPALRKSKPCVLWSSCLRNIKACIPTTPITVARVRLPWRPTTASVLFLGPLTNALRMALVLWCYRPSRKQRTLLST